MKTVVLVALLLLATAQGAEAVLINFEVDGNNNPIPECQNVPNPPQPCAPTSFGATQPLTTLYSSLGVVFSGPAVGQGGAILTDNSFGLQARSGGNILAFNTDAVPGAYAFFAETLTFSSLVSHVEIWAASGNNCFAQCGPDNTQTFVMEAFDDNNALVDSETISTRPFALLSVDAPNIRSVRITRTSGFQASEFDDLSFTFAAVPEPSGVWSMLMGSLALLGLNFWTRTRSHRE